MDGNDQAESSICLGGDVKILPRSLVGFHSSNGATSNQLSNRDWNRMLFGSRLHDSPYPIGAVGRATDLAESFTARLTAFICDKKQEPVTKRCETTPFHKKRVPTISLLEYVRRLCNYLHALEPITLITTLYYAERLSQPDVDFVLDSFCVHRFVIAAICISSKASGDNYYANSFYAKVGGIPVKELNILELELAFLLDWHLICPWGDISRIWIEIQGN